MLRIAFVLLCVAAAAGGGLGVIYLKAAPGRRPPLSLQFGHAVAGMAGLAALLLAVGGGLPPNAMGTAGFAPIAATLLVLALCVGLVLAYAAWRRRRVAAAAVAMHAGLAIAGIVMLLAVLALG